MKTLYAIFVMLVLAAMTCAQQAPPLTNQNSYPAENHKMSSKEKSQTAAAKGSVVDLNTASKKDLAALPGIGPDYAQTIIDARPFQSKGQLLSKKLIPQATYDKIKNEVTVSSTKKQSVPPGQDH